MKIEPIEKRKVLEHMLEEGLTMLHIDARRSGVVLPERFKHDPVLRLNLSYNFPHALLCMDDEGVSATLNFGTDSFRCSIPWQSIFAMTWVDRQEGMVWQEDFPPEMAEVVRQMEDEPKIGDNGLCQPKRVTEEIGDSLGEPQRSEMKNKPQLTILEGGRAGEDSGCLSENLSSSLGPNTREGGSPTELDRGGKPGETKEKRVIPPFLRIVK